MFQTLGLANTLLGGILLHKYVHMDLFVGLLHFSIPSFSLNRCPLPLEPIVWIIPALILFFGLLQFIVAILGCTGMAILNKISSITYFILNTIIITAEIAMASYWLQRTENVKDLVILEKSFAAYDISKNMRWMLMQTEMSCCGARSVYDYVCQNYTVPKECCLNDNHFSKFRMLRTVLKDYTCQPEYVKKEGCTKVFLANLQQEKYVILFFLFGGAIIKLGALAVAFIIPFEEIVEPIGWSPIGSLILNKAPDQGEESVNTDEVNEPQENPQE